MSQPTNREIVTYALAELGGAERDVHLELIAVRAFEISPGAFRWDLDEFAKFIDKDKVRVSLVDARKPKYGALVSTVARRHQNISKTTDAWRLTPDGVTWFLKNRSRLADALGFAQPRLKKGRAEEIRRRITASELYVEFQATGSVQRKPFAFADLLECSPDARNELIQGRFDDFRAQVRLLSDQGLDRFLLACGQSHADMLVQKGGVE